MPNKTTKRWPKMIAAALALAGLGLAFAPQGAQARHSRGSSSFGVSVQIGSGYYGGYGYSDGYGYSGGYCRPEPRCYEAPVRYYAPPVRYYAPETRCYEPRSRYYGHSRSYRHRY